MQSYPRVQAKKWLDLIRFCFFYEKKFWQQLYLEQEKKMLILTTRVANAVDIMEPEMRVLLGSPDQVAYFFRNLGSFLSPEDRERIRDLLDAGIPNMPISEAICLTNQELENWNNLRNRIIAKSRLDSRRGRTKGR